MSSFRVPVVIAGGGPVGMLLAHELARRGVQSLLAERNPTTTKHPKMDITNGRSMELLRRAGLDAKLRSVAIPETHGFDVSWVTTMAGYELHRFTYPSVAQIRAAIREKNDGSQPAEPPMRVSQVIIEPVLKGAIDDSERVDVRFDCAFEEFEVTSDGVAVTLRNADGSRERISAEYLVGCDGGGSRVRRQLGIGLTGDSRIAERAIIHFTSDDLGVLQRWGPAWHYQSDRGTLVAQDDRHIWTLLAVLPPGVSAEAYNPAQVLEEFVGQPFSYRLLLSNSWSPNLLVAESYGGGRVFLAGDSAHQYVPTGGYGLNTGVGDAVDLAWKLAASIHGFGGPALLASYESERRPVGIRNCAGSRRHSSVRAKIWSLYSAAIHTAGPEGDVRRAAASAQIAALGNAENESMGIEFGYIYADSPIVCNEPEVVVPDDPLVYVPTTTPGARLPSVFLDDGRSVFDHLGDWFTLVLIGATADGRAFTQAAATLGVPLTLLRLADRFGSLYDAQMLLVRPDQHIAWRGNQADAPGAARILATALGFTPADEDSTRSNWGDADTNRFDFDAALHLAATRARHFAGN